MTNITVSTEVLVTNYLLGRLVTATAKGPRSLMTVGTEVRRTVEDLGVSEEEANAALNRILNNGLIDRSLFV